MGILEMNEFLFVCCFIGIIALVALHWFKDRKKIVIKTQIRVDQNRYEEINVGGWTETEEFPLGEG